jgi:hypothetical protein
LSVYWNLNDKHIRLMTSYIKIITNQYQYFAETSKCFRYQCLCAVLSIGYLFLVANYQVSVNIKLHV